MIIKSGEHYILDKDLNLAATNEELIIEPKATLEFAKNKSVVLTLNKNAISKGLTIMKPESQSIIHHVNWVGINESLFKGGGMVPISTDIGWWNMEAGTFDINGHYRKRYTQSKGDIRKGATSADLYNIDGWQVGDEVVFAYQEMPADPQMDWDDNTGAIIADNWFPLFEVRKIKGISGTTIQFDPLLYDHLTINDSVHGEVRTYIGNKTGNVKFSGSKDGYAHIFCCAHGDPDASGHMPHFIQKHQVRNAEFYHLGPRKQAKLLIQELRAEQSKFVKDSPEWKAVQGKLEPLVSGPAGRKGLILGRYALHLHHIGWGAEGSIFENNAIHTTGNRNCVPHLSHGTTWKNNFCFNSQEMFFWWDAREVSHATLWEGNLMMMSRLNGIDAKSEGMNHSMGDDNTARGNIAIAAHQGDTRGGGAYTWWADNEAQWTFEDNISIACASPLWVWQVTVFIHLIRRFKAYNCIEWHQGSYGGNYISDDIYLYNTKLIPQATAFNAEAGWHNMIMNGINKIDRLVEVPPSPFPAMDLKNNTYAHQFRNVKFMNAKNAITIDLSNQPTEDTPGGKVVDVINCEFVNIAKPFDFLPGGHWGYFRVQEKDGTAYKLDSNGAKTTIPKFAATKNGTGTGLKGEYYNGANFDKLAIVRNDIMVYFGQWNKELPLFPLGVHNKIKDPFSIRWTGQVQALWTGNTAFRLSGGSGYRLWISGKLIIDSWNQKGDNAVNFDSQFIALAEGHKYDIKIECFHVSGDQRGILLWWKAPQMQRFEAISVFQLYPSATTTPPIDPLPPTTYKNTEKKKVFNCPSGTTGNPYTYIVPAGKYSSTVSQLDADQKADTEILDNGQIEANKNLKCTPVVLPPTPTHTAKAKLTVDIVSNIVADYRITNYSNTLTKPYREGKTLNGVLTIDITDLRGKTIYLFVGGKRIQKI